MKLLYFFLGLAIGCSLLLFICGDFTSYVGVPDRDVWVTEPNLGWRFVASASVAVTFAALATLLFAMRGKVLPGFRLVRSFLVTAPGLVAIVYLYGDFKIVFGGGPTYLVHYELPWGPERLLISAACGAGLAAVATAGVWVGRAALSEPPQAAERQPRSVKVQRDG